VDVTQLTLDQKLLPIVEKLEAKYPVGMCDEHPHLRCFLFAPKGWHFELDTAKLKVWANAIVSPFYISFRTTLIIITPASKRHQLRENPAQQQFLPGPKPN
jgi:hypothetical protein